MSADYGECSSVVTLFFAMKSLTIFDRCAGALSWKRNQLLILSFGGHFLLTASLRRRKISMWISLLKVAVTVNYISESGNFLKLLRTGYKVIKRKTPREELNVHSFLKGEYSPWTNYLILTLSITKRGGEWCSLFWTRLRAGQYVVSIPVGLRKFALLHHIQTGSRCTQPSHEWESCFLSLGVNQPILRSPVTSI